MAEFCLECKHFFYYPGDKAYSEYTPGYDAAMRCLKEHWEVEFWRDEKQDLRGKLRTAATCPDFEPDPDLQQAGKAVPEQMEHRCGECGRALTAVRPGKWQCEYCEARA